MDWLPMETAPRDKWILVDFSYWYPGDDAVTELFEVVRWKGINYDYFWRRKNERYHSIAANGWLPIPESKVRREEK